MNFGVQLYTLRHDLQKQENFRPVLERVKAMGTNTVQVSGTGAFEAQFLADLVKDLGLNICATHSPFDRIQNDLDRLAEEHLLYGCPQIGVGVMPGEFRTGNPSDTRRFADILSTAAQKLAPYHLSVAYHNHAFEFKKQEGDKTMFDILRETTDPAVQFILDTYWIRFGGENPAEYISKFQNRISVLHLKDYKKRFFLPLMKPLGKGTLDFSAILNSAKTAGATSAVIELDISKNPYKDLETSFAYLRELQG